LTASRHAKCCAREISESTENFLSMGMSDTMHSPPSS